MVDPCLVRDLFKQNKTNLEETWCRRTAYVCHTADTHSFSHKNTHLSQKHETTCEYTQTDMHTKHIQILID